MGPLLSYFCILIFNTNKLLTKLEIIGFFIQTKKYLWSVRVNLVLKFPGYTEKIFGYKKQHVN